MNYRHNISDEDREKIKERMRELAKYESGDLLTLKPSDKDIPYSGKELEGVPLQIEDVTLRHSITTKEKAKGYNDYDESRVVGKYYINQICYGFCNALSGKNIQQIFGESYLIEWEEYKENYDKVYLNNEFDDGYKYLEKQEEECPICNCDMRHISGKDNGVVHIGSENCAACGYQFSFWN